ncbi:glycosyltransferase family 2 protein [Patescibacteria group bacterium]|nr:glycosyltransferase family 2 protein [Patescibacteria group bacterium]
MTKKSVCIIIPAYNEEKSISSVISSIRKISRRYDVIVINDGSDDKTKEVTEQTGTGILNLSFNLGIGGAVQTGLKYALAKDYDIAVQVDADGQHDPRHIPQLIADLDSGTDMVIGSRFINKTNYKASFLRRLGITIFSNLILFTCGKKIFDSTSGYRVFNKKTIAFLVRNYPIDFPEPESIVKLLRNGFVIKETPVEMNRRATGESSVTPLKALYFMASISVAILIESMKKY